MQKSASINKIYISKFQIRLGKYSVWSVFPVQVHGYIAPERITVLKLTMHQHSEKEKHRTV